MIYAGGNADDGGFVDYEGLGVLALAEGELDLGVKVEYVGEGGAQEYEILVLGVAVLNSVEEEGLDEDLVALVELSAGDLASAAEICLGLYYEIFGVTLGDNFVALLGELEYQLAVLTCGLGLGGEYVVLEVALIGLSLGHIKSFAHVGASFLIYIILNYFNFTAAQLRFCLFYNKLNEISIVICVNY